MAGRTVRNIDDPRFVREEYATEEGLEGRQRAYRFAQGVDPNAVAIEAVVEGAPQTLLDAGSGTGRFADILKPHLTDLRYTGLDQSPRMVELARARGVDAVVGDVQALPFDDGTFDCVLAAWMLYHVADLDLGLGEITRVLREGGRLIAVLNGREHLGELRQMLNVGSREQFAAEDAPKRFSKHLSAVDVRDASGWIVFPTRNDAEDYVRASRSLAPKSGQLPAFETPLRVRRSVAVVIGTKAR